jgi:uncharacterized membrane protein
MAGFMIAMAACLLPFGLGVLGLGRARIAVVGAVLGFAWILSMAIARPNGAREQPPLWFGVGLVLLLYAIWCGGLWLGVRLRRLRPH